MINSNADRTAIRSNGSMSHNVPGETGLAAPDQLVFTWGVRANKPRRFTAGPVHVVEVDRIAADVVVVVGRAALHGNSQTSPHRESGGGSTPICEYCHLYFFRLAGPSVQQLAAHEMPFDYHGVPLYLSNIRTPLRAGPSEGAGYVCE
jgi:hypothetical protein